MFITCQIRMSSHNYIFSDPPIITLETLFAKPVCSFASTITPDNVPSPSEG